MLPRARWVYGELAVELGPEGKVLIQGQHELTVDRAGRVYDADNQPVALIEEDGYVYGVDDFRLGWVGAYQAIRAGDSEPWLRLTNTGEVRRISDDGQSRPFGVWLGCNGMPHTMQTCLLITHLVGLELRDRVRSRSSPSVGVGIGVGVGVGVP